MSKYNTAVEKHEQCLKEGMFLPQDNIDYNKIQSMCEIAKEDFSSVKELILKRRFNSAYKLAYDSLHTLCETLLLFDKKKSKNHQCLFSYICVHHPDLQFEWKILETIRTKRNGIHYYGSSITKQDWNTFEVTFHMYIKILNNTITQKLIR